MCRAEPALRNLYHGTLDCRRSADRRGGRELRRQAEAAGILAAAAPSFPAPSHRRGEAPRASYEDAILDQVGSEPPLPLRADLHRDSRHRGLRVGQGAIPRAGRRTGGSDVGSPRESSATSAAEGRDAATKNTAAAANKQHQDGARHAPSPRRCRSAKPSCDRSLVCRRRPRRRRRADQREQRSSRQRQSSLVRRAHRPAHPSETQAATTRAADSLSGVCARPACGHAR
jgi:hypothetical protein